jgi:hypothetical protein
VAIKRTLADGTEYGCHLVRGEPGSGKSYIATRLIVRQLCGDTPRPIYTNLPLRWRVLRRWLSDPNPASGRPGPAVANLIRELNEEHWRAFLSRQALRARHEEKYRSTRGDDRTWSLDGAALDSITAACCRDGDATAYRARLASATALTPPQKQALFVHLHGPDVVAGPGANWIPSGAWIVVDEVHHWHPLAIGGAKEDSKLLIDYLSKHRHHRHLVWFITQEEDRVDKNLRAYAHFFWRVRDRAEDRLAWGLRFGHLGIRALSYERFTREAWNSGRAVGSEAAEVKHRPLESMIVFHTLPWNRWVFRLYRSESHAGSPGELRRAREQLLKDAGLSEAGKDPEHIRRRQLFEQEKAKKERSLGMRFIRVSGRVLTTCCIGAAVGLAGYAVGNRAAVDQAVIEAEIEHRAAAASPTDPAAQAAGFSTVATPAETPPPVVEAVLGRSLVISGKRAAEGFTHGAYTLVAADLDTRDGLWVSRDGIYWMWRLGEHPQRLGTSQDVAAALTAAGVAIDPDGPGL